MLRLLSILSLFSCINEISNIPDGTHFRKELEMEVNGITGVGTMVVPASIKYTIKIKMDERSERIKLSTCHRDYDIKKSGWTGRKNHVFEFFPATDIENEGYCPIFIAAFDLQGQHAWGMVEIKNRGLIAHLYCNGSSFKKTGVSLCQSREGLLQRISFLENVDFASDDKSCEIMTQNKKVFDIPLRSGICVYVFRNRKQKKIHRLTTFGYNKVNL